MEINESKNCFIVCPISEEGSEERKRSDEILNHLITPILNDLNYNIIRIDQIPHSGQIDSEILEYLKNSELVIADITGNNPNVFFELGYRVGLNKPVIQILEKGPNVRIPFDRAMFNTIFYNLKNVPEFEKNKEDLKARIIRLEEEKKNKNQLTEESKWEEEMKLNFMKDVLGNIFQNIKSVDDLLEVSSKMEELKKMK